MTTLVTVKANGPNYPARVIKKDASGTEVHNELIASGHSVDLWVGVNETITVTEEYHADGFSYVPVPALPSDGPHPDTVGVPIRPHP